MSGSVTEGWESDNTQFHTRHRACVSASTRVPDRLAVLLVEHDSDIARELTDAFVGQPVEVRQCTDPAVALLQVGRTCPDVVLLGPASGRLGAADFLAIIRELDHELPIIVGAGAGAGDLAAQAAELGATAVVRRPYQARELLGLLRSFAPRPDAVELRPMVIDLGRLRVDGAVPQFWLDGRVVALPPQEFVLLRYFAERLGAVLTRAELNRAVWGDKLGVRSNSLTVHIMRLRKRLGDEEHNPKWVKVVRGLGYQFTVPPAADTATGPAGDPTRTVPAQATPSERSPDVHTG
ncbi:response regulator transcription factor [Actinophytocola sp.]|uniref:response regulator transcription factor n=1 Tax=Actinophytocola sp. TaxID=1872138 RepID=UPI003D6C3F30